MKTNKETIKQIAAKFPALIWSILTTPITPLTIEEEEEDKAYYEFQAERGEWL